MPTTRDALERLAAELLDEISRPLVERSNSPVLTVGDLTRALKKVAASLPSAPVAETAYQAAARWSRERQSSEPDRAPGADAGETPQALTAAIMQADRETWLEQALRDLMTAYERRVRSSCTPADIDKQPWRCDEFVAAEDVLRQRGKEG
jgi:hypothetical protein